MQAGGRTPAVACVGQTRARARERDREKEGVIGSICRLGFIAGMLAAIGSRRRKAHNGPPVMCQLCASHVPVMCQSFRSYYAVYQLGAEHPKDLERGRATEQRDLLGRADVGRGRSTCLRLPWQRAENRGPAGERRRVSMHDSSRPLRRGHSKAPTHKERLFGSGGTSRWKVPPRAAPVCRPCILHTSTCVCVTFGRVAKFRRRTIAALTGRADRDDGQT